MRIITYTLLAGILIVGGCCKPNASNDYVSNVFIEDCQLEHAMEISRKVLSYMHFKIDKYDTQQGFITTQPLRGGQFFEFWRGDNANKSTGFDSNIHNLVRTVALELFTEPNGVRVSCVSNVKRLSMPGREAYSVSQTGMLYSKKRRGTTTLVPKGEYNWIDLGRDKALETKISTQIKNEKQLKDKI